MTYEGKYPEYIIDTIPSLNDEAHAVVSGDGEATVLTESRDIDTSDFAGLKNRHALWDFHRAPIKEHFNRVFLVGEMDSGFDHEGQR